MERRIKNRTVIEQEEFLKSKAWRIRQVRSGPDGYLYLSTDSGELVKIVPQPQYFIENASYND